MSEESNDFKMSEESRILNGLTDDNARRFRLQLLDIYIAGYLAWDSVWNTTKDGPTCSARHRAGYTADDSNNVCSSKCNKEKTITTTDCIHQLSIVNT